MGTFVGHAVPGLYFFMFGLWFMVNIWIRYYKALKGNGVQYKNTVTFKCGCLCGRAKNWQIEGFLKVVAAITGFIGESATAFENGTFYYIGNGQHITMYFFYGLSGVVDLLLHYNFPLPKKLDYFTLLIAIFTEGILFKFHLHDREEFDTTVHVLLIYAVFLTMLPVLAEMYWEHNILPALARALCFMLQGTWFIHVGFLLYSPLPNPQKWDNSGNSIMYATMFFTWHIGALFVLTLVIAFIVRCWTKCSSTCNDDAMAMQSLLKKDQNGHTVVRMYESESETEFQCPQRLEGNEL